MLHLPMHSPNTDFKPIVDWINPYHAEYIKMPHPLLISSQSDYLIQVFDRNSHI